MVTLMLTQEVKNYDEWKKHFDSGEEMRTSGGVKLVALYRGNDNGNMVTVITEMASAEVAHAFVSNPALKDAMEKSGVLSTDLKIMTKVG